MRFTHFWIVDVIVKEDSEQDSSGIGQLLVKVFHVQYHLINVLHVVIFPDGFLNVERW